jgi:hypothetical protein
MFGFVVAAVWACEGGREMPEKRLGAEQIIPKLREAEVDLAKGWFQLEPSNCLAIAARRSNPHLRLRHPESS